MEMFQSNIYYYVRIKGYIVSTQEISCIYRRDSCVHTRDSCACTRFLCMHKILAHAQHSCACTTLLCMHWAREPRGQGPSHGPGCQGPGLGPKKAAGPVPGPGPLPFWVPGLGPGPSSACTRVLCMHKSVVHAQKSCAYTRIKCIHEISCVDTIYSFILT